MQKSELLFFLIGSPSARLRTAVLTAQAFGPSLFVFFARARVRRRPDRTLIRKNQTLLSKFYHILILSRPPKIIVGVTPRFWASGCPWGQLAHIIAEFYYLGTVSSSVACGRLQLFPVLLPPAVAGVCPLISPASFCLSPPARAPTQKPVGRAPRYLKIQLHLSGLAWVGLPIQTIYQIF